MANVYSQLTSHTIRLNVAKSVVVLGNRSVSC